MKRKDKRILCGALLLALCVSAIGCAGNARAGNGDTRGENNSTFEMRNDQPNIEPPNQQERNLSKVS